MGEKSNSKAPALTRGLEILEVLAGEEAELTFALLKNILNIPGPSLWRILNVLRDSGYVIYDPEVDYQILSPVDGSTVATDKVTTTGFVEAGALIKINGKLADVGQDGGFSYDIALQTGKNTITYIIEDPAGNTETVSIYVTRKGSSMQPSSSSQGLNIGFGILIVILLLLIVIVFARSRSRPKEPVEIHEVDHGAPPPPDYEAAGFTPLVNEDRGTDEGPGPGSGIERVTPPPRLQAPPTIKKDVDPEPFPGDGPDEGRPGGGIGEAEAGPGETQTDVKAEKDLLDEIDEKETERSLGDRTTETEQEPGEGEGPKVVVDREARTRKRHAARMRRRKKRESE